MEAKDLGGIDREWAVHVHRQSRNLVVGQKLVQAVDDILGAAHRKGRDDHLASPVVDLVDDIAEPGDLLFAVPVLAIAIRALGDQQVHVGRHLGVTDQRRPRTAQVAAKEQPPRRPPLLDLEQHHSRTQDVPGIIVGQSDAGGDRQRAMVIEAEKIFQAAPGVGVCVQGFDKWLAAPAVLFVDVRGIRLVDVCRVAEHNRAQVARAGCAQDVSLESAADQRGDVARVVDVCV